MAQLLTLIWLKWKLFRNSLRSSKAVANQLALLVGMLVALVLSCSVAIGLGVASYAITRLGLAEAIRQSGAIEVAAVVHSEFIFFSILTFLYLMWATVPLSIGNAKQFDVAKMLMYPISLPKLFAFDFISEITTLQSVFAIPAIIAMGIGAGLGTGGLPFTLVATVPIIVFGMSLSKWLTTVVGALVRRKRSRGETLVALIGAIAGLGAALAGQVAPLVFRHAESVRYLRWTPPGAAAVLVMGREVGVVAYLIAFITLSLYAITLIGATYWIARRSALGLGGHRKRSVVAESKTSDAMFTGWRIPLFSAQLSAMVEKEIRYALRNAQLRTLALMPLILIIIRLFNSRRMSSDLRGGGRAVESFFQAHGSGLMLTGGVLYVFLLLGGLSCNLFAFEEGGMRTLILSPVDRKKILVGKNIAVILVALVFSIILVITNAVIFRDVSIWSLSFTALNFVVFAALMAVIGNWFSLRFPKYMKFGKRMNVSGVAGLLMIPLIGILSLPSGLAVFVGYMSGNRVFEYATLASFAVLSLLLYGLAITLQGESLLRRELEILETVKAPVDD